jgi:hypothetical protein
MLTIEEENVVIHLDGFKHPACEEINKVTKIEERIVCLL